jgi:hypothetical protein
MAREEHRQAETEEPRERQRNGQCRRQEQIGNGPEREMVDEDGAMLPPSL